MYSATLTLIRNPVASHDATYMINAEWQKPGSRPRYSDGHLPSATTVFNTYREWREYYNLLVVRPLIQVAPTPVPYTITRDGLMLRSRKLKTEFNNWLDSSPSFNKKIEQLMRNDFKRDEPILVKIRTSDRELLQLMRFNRWDFFDDFTNAELVMI